MFESGPTGSVAQASPSPVPVRVARGASGTPWQGVRQGVQRGVCGSVSARGGAVVGRKGCLIFLYSFLYSVWDRAGEMF